MTNDQSLLEVIANLIKLIKLINSSSIHPILGLTDLGSLDRVLELIERGSAKNPLPSPSARGSLDLFELFGPGATGESKLSPSDQDSLNRFFELIRHGPAKELLRPPPFTLEDDGVGDLIGPLSSRMQPAGWSRFLGDLSTVGSKRFSAFVENYISVNWPSYSLNDPRSCSWFYTNQMVQAKALVYVLALRQFAEKEHGSAARQLAKIAILSTISVNKILREKPGTFEQVAKQEFSWPVLKSPHPHFSEPDPDWTALKLGGAFPFSLSKKSRFNPNDDAGRIAWRLWHYVFALREFARQCKQKGELDAVHQKQEAPSLNCLADAYKLSDFRDDPCVIQKWFKVAKQCLVESYPSKSKVGEFDDTNPFLKRIAKVGKGKKGLHSRISEAIEKRFYGFVGAEY